MMGFGLIWILLIIGLIAYLMGWRPDFGDNRSPGRDESHLTPLEILKERYARGEINREEYQEMWRDLQSSS